MGTYCLNVLHNCVHNLWRFIHFLYCFYFNKYYFINNLLSNLFSLFSFFLLTFIFLMFWFQIYDLISVIFSVFKIIVSQIFWRWPYPKLLWKLKCLYVDLTIVSYSPLLLFNMFLVVTSSCIHQFWIICQDNNRILNTHFVVGVQNIYIRGEVTDKVTNFRTLIVVKTSLLGYIYAFIKLLFAEPKTCDVKTTRKIQSF